MRLAILSASIADENASSEKFSSSTKVKWRGVSPSPGAGFAAEASFSVMGKSRRLIPGTACEPISFAWPDQEHIAARKPPLPPFRQAHGGADFCGWQDGPIGV